MKINFERKQVVVETAKIVVGITAAIGVGILVGTALRQIPIKQQTAIGKVCVGIGIMVLEGIASEAAVQYVSKTVDEIDAAFQIGEAFKIAGIINQNENLN